MSEKERRKAINRNGTERRMMVLYSIKEAATDPNICEPANHRYIKNSYSPQILVCSFSLQRVRSVSQRRALSAPERNDNPRARVISAIIKPKNHVERPQMRYPRAINHPVHLRLVLRVIRSAKYPVGTSRITIAIENIDWRSMICVIVSPCSCQKSTMIGIEKMRLKRTLIVLSFQMFETIGCIYSC